MSLLKRRIYCIFKIRSFFLSKLFYNEKDDKLLMPNSSIEHIAPVRSNIFISISKRQDIILIYQELIFSICILCRRYKSTLFVLNLYTNIKKKDNTKKDQFIRILNKNRQNLCSNLIHGRTRTDNDDFVYKYVFHE